MTARTELTFLADFAGMELFCAEFGKQRFPRHFHEWHMIKVIEEGAVAGRISAQDYASRAGCVFLSNPFEAHSGFSIDHVRYRAFFVPPEIMRRVAGERPIVFGRSVFRDHDIAAALLSSHRRIQDGGRGGLRAFEAILARIAASVGRPAIAEKHDRRVSKAIEELSSTSCKGPDISGLAHDIGVSRNHLTRLFLRSVGLPPHEYNLNLRLEKARRRLQVDPSPARVAQDFGFSDQSHFGRLFKRYFGLSPGAYLRSRS